MATKKNAKAGAAKAEANVRDEQEQHEQPDPAAKPTTEELADAAR